MRHYDNDNEISFEGEALDLISEMPIELAKENIKAQLKMPNTDTNNIQIVLEKFKYVLDNYGEDPDQRLEILDEKQKFLCFVKDSVCETFDLGITVDEDDIEELEEITESLYDSLVVHFKKNIVKFFTNYILAHKEDFVDEYKSFIEKRDLSGVTYKNSIVNITVDDYIILVALPLIHKSIYDLTVEIDPIDFLDVSGCSMLYSGSVVKEYLEDGRLCGSFVPSYMKILTTTMEIYKQTILENVKQELIKRFKARSL